MLDAALAPTSACSLSSVTGERISLVSCDRGGRSHLWEGSVEGASNGACLPLVAAATACAHHPADAGELFAAPRSQTRGILNGPGPGAEITLPQLCRTSSTLAGLVAVGTSGGHVTFVAAQGSSESCIEYQTLAVFGDAAPSPVHGLAWLRAPLPPRASVATGNGDSRTPDAAMARAEGVGVPASTDGASSSYLLAAALSGGRVVVVYVETGRPSLSVGAEGFQLHVMARVVGSCVMGSVESVRQKPRKDGRELKLAGTPMAWVDLTKSEARGGMEVSVDGAEGDEVGPNSPGDYVGLILCGCFGGEVLAIGVAPPGGGQSQGTVGAGEGKWARTGGSQGVITGRWTLPGRHARGVLSVHCRLQAGQGHRFAILTSSADHSWQLRECAVSDSSVDAVSAAVGQADVEFRLLGIGGTATCVRSSPAGCALAVGDSNRSVRVLWAADTSRSGIRDVHRAALAQGGAGEGAGAVPGSNVEVVTLAAGDRLADIVWLPAAGTLAFGCEDGSLSLARRSGKGKWKTRVVWERGTAGEMEGVARLVAHSLGRDSTVPAEDSVGGAHGDKLFDGAVLWVLTSKGRVLCVGPQLLGSNSAQGGTTGGQGAGAVGGRQRITPMVVPSTLDDLLRSSSRHNGSGAVEQATAVGDMQGGAVGGTRRRSGRLGSTTAIGTATNERDPACSPVLVVGFRDGRVGLFAVQESISDRRLPAGSGGLRNDSAQNAKDNGPDAPSGVGPLALRAMEGRPVPERAQAQPVCRSGEGVTVSHAFWGRVGEATGRASESISAVDAAWLQVAARDVLVVVCGTAGHLEAWVLEATPRCSDAFAGDPTAALVRSHVLRVSCGQKVISALSARASGSNLAVCCSNNQKASLTFQRLSVRQGDQGTGPQLAADAVQSMDIGCAVFSVDWADKGFAAPMGCADDESLPHDDGLEGLCVVAATRDKTVRALCVEGSGRVGSVEALSGVGTDGPLPSREVGDPGGSAVSNASRLEDHDRGSATTDAGVFVSSRSALAFACDATPSASHVDEILRAAEGEEAVPATAVTLTQAQARPQSTRASAPQSSALQMRSANRAVRRTALRDAPVLPCQRGLVKGTLDVDGGTHDPHGVTMSGSTRRLGDVPQLTLPTGCKGRLVKSCELDTFGESRSFSNSARHAQRTFTAATIRVALDRASLSLGATWPKSGGGVPSKERGPSAVLR